jgi:DNA-binding transcriptional LysR family regulator
MSKLPSQARSDVANRAALDLIDSRRMFYFFHVARLGSLTMAETYLDIAQPAITRQIKQFESDLGLDLFTRNGHGVKLTENGRIVYERVEAMLDQMTQTRLRIEQLRHAAPLQVSVAASSSFTIAHMPKIVERFIAEQPGLHLQVREASQS